MIVEGRAVVIPGDDVDTDVMYPGSYLNVEDPEEMKNYLFDGYDPSLRDRLGPDAIVVTGRNFGLGSSREHVVQALRAWGVPAVLGKSFARIFRRNCVNLGLAIFEAPQAADAARPGSTIRIDTEACEIEVDGRMFTTPPVAELVAELQAAGGLVPWTKERANDRP
jgi:3-isopropylmalate/(R)-2-methylmalate dehydratase small subunit